jgi:hypothetical protein
MRAVIDGDIEIAAAQAAEGVNGNARTPRYLRECLPTHRRTMQRRWTHRPQDRKVHAESSRVRKLFGVVTRGTAQHILRPFSRRA